jgi:chromosomal replication initiator protein
MEQESDFAAKLAKQIGKNQFDVWIAGQVVFVSQENSIQILGATEFGLDRIKRQFGLEIARVAGGYSKPLKVEYSVKSDSDNHEPSGDTMANFDPQSNSGNFADSNGGTLRSYRGNSQTKKPAARKVLRSKKAYPFQFCENNKLAATTVGEILRHPGQLSPVVFHGPAGCGKSTILSTVKSQFHKCRMVMMSAEQFTTSYLGALNGGGLPMFRRKYRDLDLLIVDDIQFFQGKRATTVEFQHTIDSLMADRQIVLSSDRPPNELDFLSTELATRLSAGLVCPLNFPGQETRKKILKDFCEQRGYDFETEVLQIIAEKMPYDVRRMSGALNRLRMATFGQHKKSITAERAAVILKDLFEVEHQYWSLKQIETAVCEAAGITKQEIRSASRSKRVCAPRMLAMWLSRQYTRAALSEIGDHFGGRSHSTVIAATKKMDSVIDADDVIQFANRPCRAKEILAQVRRDIQCG